MKKSFCLNFCLAPVALGMAACGAEIRPPEVGVMVGVKGASAALTGAGLLSVNGSYGAGCKEREGDWSVAVATDATLDNPELSVVMNDADCVLTLTAIRTTSGLLPATPSIGLAADYASTPASFGTPVLLYANAKLSNAEFSADFVIDLVFSDDPALPVASHSSSFAIASAAASESAVSAPNYTIDMTGISVQVDEANVVQTASGAAELTANSVTGQTVVMSSGSTLTTYAEIDAAYLAGTPASLTLALSASFFDLTGATLTGGLVRNLIIANELGGVRSYQVFKITFN